MTAPSIAEPGSPGSRFRHFAPITLPPLFALLAALTCAATPPKSAAPPATATPSGAELRSLLLPTVDEWIQAHGRPSTQRSAFPEELPLLEYTAPGVEVLAVDPRGGCPEPRKEPTFDVIFDREGRVAAIQSAESMPCPPLADAWKDAIATWRLREPDSVGTPAPALIRITARARKQAPQPPAPPKTPASPAKPGTASGGPPAGRSPSSS